MNTNIQKSQAMNTEFLVRPRISALLTQAVEKPLVFICAGTGYGKTRAVYDFTKNAEIPTTWIQISEYDIIPSRFWENFINGISQSYKDLSEKLKEIGFPDTDEKLSRISAIDEAAMPKQKHLVVLDDFHLITQPTIIQGIESIARKFITNRTFILVGRELPKINFTSLQAMGNLCFIYEEDLVFTENELYIYLNNQGISLELQVLHEIYQDIKGWAFAVNLVARSLKKSPGYMGYARIAFRHNIFTLMESEVFNTVSERLQHFSRCANGS